MLIQFTTKNHRSFKDEVSLDLSATAIQDFKERNVQIGQEKLLRAAAIYGANASGKSNLFDAFKFMTRYVVNSFMFGGENAEEKSKSFDMLQLGSEEGSNPFIFDERSKSEPSLYEIYIIDNITAITYQYGFSILGNSIQEEWLYKKAKTSKDYRVLFHRELNKITDVASSISKEMNLLSNSIQEETLIVSLGSKLKFDTFTYIRNWFYNNEVIDYGDIIQNFLLSYDPFSKKHGLNELDLLAQYASTFDEGIKKFILEEEVFEIDGVERVRDKISPQHKNIDSDEYTSIDISEESSGTNKMLSLYGSLKEVFEKGSLLFIDELNARLHPLLVRNIILSFLNPEINTGNAQIVFTTHDIWQLSSEILRRDEIWFVEKNSHGISELFSLADYKDENGNKIRNDESYFKNYLTGKYGAIPALKPIILKGSKIDA